MKILFLFLSFSICLLSFGQDPTAKIATARAYNSANIVTNNVKAITATKVNTANTKILDAIAALRDSATGSTGWGLTGNTGTSSITKYIGTNDTASFIIRTNSVPAITVTQDGNTGIGTTTPNSKLDVNGDVNVTGSVAAYFYYGNGSNLTSLPDSRPYKSYVARIYQVSTFAPAVAHYFPDTGLPGIAVSYGRTGVGVYTITLTWDNTITTATEDNFTINLTGLLKYNYNLVSQSASGSTTTLVYTINNYDHAGGLVDGIYRGYLEIRYYP
jgi:hypothetical protein